MDHFALLPAPERAIVFRETAARLRVGSATIALKRISGSAGRFKGIFSSATLPGPLFKGGTSLSKVYKVIERFSEDVDIVLDRHALGFTGEQDPSNIAGTNKRNRKLDELAIKCSEMVHGAVRHELQESFRAVLREADWDISEDLADADRQSLLFTYPLGLEENLYGLGNYIRPVVRLEFGCRGDVWPSERQPVQPYVADALPGILAKPTANVHVLRPERTFWEKATLLHAVFHSGKMPTRLSRHYYDLARLYRHEYGQNAVADFGLLASVVEHKKVFFREAAARYQFCESAQEQYETTESSRKKSTRELLACQQRNASNINCGPATSLHVDSTAIAVLLGGFLFILGISELRQSILTS
jgi:hypothetical protein